VEGANLLLMVLVGATYSVIHPLLLPFVAVFFGVGYLGMKYKLLYVRVPTYEGEGNLYIHILSLSLSLSFPLSLSLSLSYTHTHTHMYVCVYIRMYVCMYTHK
jgi:hypothetical protein